MKIAALSLFLTLALPGKVYGIERRPNFIVMQPDDLEFFEEWMPPAHFPNTNEFFTYDGVFGLPNLDRLRSRGLHMKQAYTTSPVCGTSRYSTMTGRYPSRAATSRNRNSDSIIALFLPSDSFLSTSATLPRSKSPNLSYDPTKQSEKATVFQSNPASCCVRLGWESDSPGNIFRECGSLSSEKMQYALNHCCLFSEVPYYLFATVTFYSIFLRSPAPSQKARLSSSSNRFQLL